MTAHDQKLHLNGRQYSYWCYTDRRGELTRYRTAAFGVAFLRGEGDTAWVRINDTDDLPAMLSQKQYEEYMEIDLKY